MSPDYNPPPPLATQSHLTRVRVLNQMDVGCWNIKSLTQFKIFHSEKLYFWNKWNQLSGFLLPSSSLTIFISSHRPASGFHSASSVPWVVLYLFLLRSITCMSPLTWVLLGSLRVCRFEVLFLWSTERAKRLRFLIIYISWVYFNPQLT